MTDFFVKLMLTFMVVGFLLVLCAAGIQDSNRHLADALGYSGLATLTVSISTFFLYLIWFDD